MSGPEVSRRGFLAGVSAVALAGAISVPREPYLQGVIREWGGDGLFPQAWGEAYNGLGYAKYERIAKIFAEADGFRFDESYLFADAKFWRITRCARSRLDCVGKG